MHSILTFCEKNNSLCEFRVECKTFYLRVVL